MRELLNGLMEESTLDTGIRENNMGKGYISVAKERKSMENGNMVKESDGLNSDFNL